MDYEPLRRGFAEFVGTFAFVFVGAGSVLTIAKALAPAIVNAQALDVYGGLTLVGVALANGVAIAVMVSAVGHISGGHLNPAVTLGFFVTRRIAPSLAIVYWSMQFAAAAAAAALLRWLYPESARRLTHLGAPGPTSGAWIWYAGPFIGGALAALVYDTLYLRTGRPLLPVGPPDSGVAEPRPGDTSVS